MLRKGNPLLLHMWHPSCYYHYNPGISHEWGEDQIPMKIMFDKNEIDSLVYKKNIFMNSNIMIPLTGVTQPHLCSCPNLWPWFPTSHVVVFFVFSQLKWEVIVRFVEIGGIVDHHYLTFFAFYGVILTSLVCHFVDRISTHSNLYWCSDLTRLSFWC